MDQIAGNDKEGFHSMFLSRRPGVNTKQRVLIQKYLHQQPTDSDTGLQAWYSKYTAADARELAPTHWIIKEVKDDRLDEEAVERCINELAEGISVSGGFCAECRHLFNNWPNPSDPDAKDSKTQGQWPGWCSDWGHVVARECHTMVLEAGTRKGCRFCKFLFQMINDGELLETIRKIEVRMVKLESSETASLSLQNWIYTSQILWVNFPGKICDNNCSGIAQYINFEGLVRDATADTYGTKQDALDIAKRWVGECALDHEDCSAVDDGKLPTRLISIAGGDLRLVLTNDWNTKPRYGTLSHCWGEQSFLKLTKQNYSSFLEEIPYDQLPLTFKDAIDASRRLGLEYLWIDSLCIVQGDTEDWRYEASRMSSVYGGSFVNLAASSALNAHGGLFKKLPNAIDGLRVLVNVGGFKAVHEFRSSDVYTLSTRKTHLATRAWTIQERILPVRTIHFTNRGAFWECRAKIANEYLPDGFTNHLHTDLINLQSRQKGFHVWWSNVVGLYSAAHLTFPQDRLPALSGIAQQVQKETGLQYCAGMWRDRTFMAQLCWRVSFPRKQPFWRAPTWSWASVDGQVSFQSGQDDEMGSSFAHILDVDLDYLGEDQFGEIRNGRLRVGCSGMLATKFVNDRTHRVHFSEQRSDEVKCLDFPVRFDSWDEDVSEGGEVIYAMPLLSGPTGFGTGNEENGYSTSQVLIRGILLKVMGNIRGHFLRVGYFEFENDWRSAAHEPNLYEEFLELFEEKAASVGKGVCLQVSEEPETANQPYVIDIF